ncbi:metallophosphoesterase [Acetivibrio thermocellus]|uniref:metallophosphoesterase n=1 Tax=Acetivibrio thermocellus TaxID=1515 RepID=UPI0021ADF899|nr:metallophosphoesterase [Acetivibrio thermocellus]UWV47995.1 metallophosphoesterase [Acetivibrio thermocellus]
MSDLHSKEFGKGQKNLVKKIEDAQPDLIVFTGDLIDSRHFDAEVSLELIRQIVKIAPTYFVTGNHERWSGNFDALEKVLKENGIHVLRNTCDRIGKDKDGIYITGIDDPVSTQAIYEETKVVENEIKQALKEIKENDVFKILLAHRPEMLPLYSEYGFDLVLSGHAHGGQVRLPFIGGLIAPNQGFFPEYTSGEYKRGNCTMIVSRGLGNSIIFQRLFNHPEIVVLTLSKGK